jgi:hypothetical protein
MAQAGTKESPVRPGLNSEHQLVFDLCRSRVTGLLVSFVFCSALLHQITVLARHRVRLERLLAHFASTGISVGRDWSNDEA